MYGIERDWKKIIEGLELKKEIGWFFKDEE